MSRYIYNVVSFDIKKEKQNHKNKIHLMLGFFLGTGGSFKGKHYTREQR